MYDTYKRRGFTLVELLIVILVIGVLSVMMILSSTESVTTAKVSNIIANLTNLKRAVTAWYLDNYDRFIYVNDSKKFQLDGTTEIHTYIHEHPEEIQKYFSSSFKASDGVLHSGTKQTYDSFYATVGGYAVYMGEQNTRCYVLYKLSDDSTKKDYARLREKLMGRAKSAGLLSYAYNRGAGKKAQTYDGGNYVFMEVFRLSK